MNRTTFRKIPFIIWMTIITVLSVIPHADDGIVVSTNVTSSGMEKHIAGYFLAALLCYYAYMNKESGLGVHDIGYRKDVFLSGLFIFLYSVALEAVQFFLPYRTFNVYDIVANGIGVVAFVFVWMLFISHPG